MARPICFVIMPYGVKETQPRPGAKDAPAKVDYDKLWEKAYLPAIDQLGYSAVRADFDLGGMIIKDMLQRLGLCDLVIADISIPNANVYYEVGIRHAAAAQGCVLLAAHWADVPFDLKQIKQLRYGITSQVIDDAAAATMVAMLIDKVPEHASGDSPFHSSIPGFPGKVNLGDISAFKSQLAELSEFQSAVRFARFAATAELRRSRALALRDEYRSSGPIQEPVALELILLIRDCTDAPTTIAYIDGLPPRIRHLPVVQEQRALVQSHGGNHEEAIAALEQLIAIAGDTPERRGLIGGRYKRLWRDATDPATKSKYLDLAIKHYNLGMHLDLNAYYSTCNLPVLYRARGRRGDEEKAAVAAAVTQVACDRARSTGSGDEWLKPTLLFAAFFAANVDKARELADEVREQGAVAWKLESTLQDLENVIAFTRADRVDELTEILADLKSA
jgi:hypothetical protein